MIGRADSRADADPLDSTRYAPRIANISRAEFEELMAIVRSPPDRAVPLSDDDLWRRAHQEEQRERRVMGYQQDLFGGPTTSHYHRLARAPEVERPAAETIEDKLERIKGDPSATFGPTNPNRPAFPDHAEREAIVRSAANWLHVRQRVRIVDAPGAVDPAYGPERFVGRTGVIWRRCSSTFADRVYVFLDPVRGERVDKIPMVEVRDLEPLLD